MPGRQTNIVYSILSRGRPSATCAEANSVIEANGVADGSKQPATTGSPTFFPTAIRPRHARA